MNSLFGPNFARDLTILVIFALPAWALAMRRSRWLVPYVLLAWAVGPEVRRVNDWFLGTYQNITLVSLIPMVATGALLIPIFDGQLRASVRLKKGLTLICAVIFYGTVVGVLLNGMSAAFEGLQMLVPLLLIPYALSQPYEAKQRDLWLSTLSTIAVLVAIYGWYQFLEAPPWDMKWMMDSGMFSSHGLPKPESFRVFSTLNSCGPLGVYMAAALVVGLCDRRWRKPFGLLGSLIIGSCLLITQVRLGWVMFAVAAASYFAVQRGSNRWKSLGAVAFVAITVLYVFPMLPGAELISARVDTMSDLNEDASLNGRMEQTIEALNFIASHPLGSGYGATGRGGKLVTKNGGTGGADNGYVDLAITLGPLGLIIFFAGIFILGLEPYRIAKSLPRKASLAQSALRNHAALAVAMLIAYAAGTLMYNNFGGVGGAMFWLVLACPLSREKIGAIVDARGETQPRAGRLGLRRSGQPDVVPSSERARFGRNLYGSM